MTAIGVCWSHQGPPATADRCIDAGRFLFPGRSRAAVLRDKFWYFTGQKLSLCFSAVSSFFVTLALIAYTVIPAVSPIRFICISAPHYTYIVFNTVFEVHGILPP